MITDTFNRADQADLTGASGYGWPWNRLGSGTTGISSNALGGTSGFANYRADFEVGSNDVEVEADFVRNSGIPGVRGRVHLTNDTGYVFIITNTFYRLQRFAPGSATTIATETVSTAASGRAKITCIGDTITGYINGVQVIQATDSAYTEGECGGIYLNGNATLDNFSAQAANCNSAYEGAALCLPMQDNDASTDVVAFEYGVSATAATLEGGDDTEDIDTTGPGKGFASALDLDGAADYVSLPDFTAADWSCALRVEPGDITTQQYLLSRAAQADIILGYQSGKYNIFGGSYATGTAADTEVAATGVGSWDHLLFTKSGTALTGYLNGVEVFSETITSGDFDPTGTGILGNNAALNKFADAKLADFSLHQSVLNSDNAADIYAGPEPRYESGAVLNADGTYDLGSWGIGPGFLDGILSGSNDAYDALASDANLQVWYNGDANGDGTGDADDASGNGRDGTWIGTAAYADGVIGGQKAFDFDGSVYFNIPDGEALGIPASTGAFTYSLRFTAGTTSGTQVLLETGGATNGQLIHLTGNTLYAVVVGSGTAVSASVTGIVAGQAYNMTAVYDLDGDLAIYLDGVQVDSTSLITFTRPNSGSDGGGLGANHLQVRLADQTDTGTSGDFAFTGTIEDVMILDRALTPAEVASYHNAAQRYQARLRNATTGEVIETLAASGLDTGGFSSALTIDQPYTLESRKQNDGGWSSWTILQSTTIRSYDALSPADTLETWLKCQDNDGASDTVTNDGDSGRSWFSRYSTTSNPTANISVPATGAPLVATFPLAFQLDNSPNVERLTLTADTTSPTYDAVTVAAWLKTTVDDTNAKLICGWNASGSANTFALFVDDDVMGNNGQLRVVLKNAAGSTVFDLHGGFANGLQLNDGDWHHVAMVYDVASNALKLYIDATRLATSGVLGSAETIGGTASSRFTVGAYANSNNPLDMAIQDVRVYGEALSDDEIANLMAGPVVAGEGDAFSLQQAVSQSLSQSISQQI